MKEQAPNSTVGEIAKKLGAAWRVMTDDQKQPYEQQAKCDRERYEKEMELYRKGEFAKSDGGEDHSGSDSENEDE